MASKLFKTRSTSEDDQYQHVVKDDGMFPPLIASIDTYLNAATDSKIHEVKTAVRAEKKKHRKKKTTVDSSSTLLTNSMEIVSTSESNGILTVVQRPVSQKNDSFSSPRRIKLISPETDFRYQNDNIMLSPVKTAPLPQPSNEFSAAKVSPRSRAGRMKKANDPPPPRTAVEAQISPNSNVFGGQDLGFGKAVESIAALKLHNFAMRRRDHVSHKLKLLKEIRGYERENNEELIVAAKYRNKEFLAAWKLRYYVEYMRLNAMKHIVDVVEGKNQELEDECATLQRNLNESRQYSTQLNAELESTRSSLDEAHSRIDDLTAQITHLSSTLSTTQNDLLNKNQVVAYNTADKAIDTATKDEQQAKIEVLRGELAMTRLTCQELIRSSVIRDGEFEVHHAQLNALQAVHNSIEEELAAFKVLHREDGENALMREEDGEIRTIKLNTMNKELENREATITAFQLQVSGLNDEVALLKDQLDAANSAITAEKALVTQADVDKAGLSKILTELAVKISRLEDDAEKRSATITDLEKKAKVSANTISDQSQAAEDLAQQIATSLQEIDFLSDENEELAREIECHSMYGADMDERHRVLLEATNRNVEYSRFLEEELFTARKLYEKQTTLEKDLLDAGDTMHGAVEPESYGFGQSERGSMKSGNGKNRRRHNSGFEGEQIPEEEPGDLHSEENGGSERPQSAIDKLIINMGDITDMGNGQVGYRPMPSPGRVRTNSYDSSRPSTTPFVPIMMGSAQMNQGFSTSNARMMEDRLLQLVKDLEDKMKGVDNATESLRVMTARAEALEEQRSMSASITSVGGGGRTMFEEIPEEDWLRQQQELRDQQEAQNGLLQAQLEEDERLQQEEKELFINEHLGMENLFAQIQSSLDQVCSQIEEQKEEIFRLQDERSHCKTELSLWRKRFKKANHGEEPTDQDKEEFAGDLVAQFSELKELINAHKEESVELNSQAVALQEELFHLNEDLDSSANQFEELYGEPINTYLPDVVMPDPLPDQEGLFDYPQEDNEPFSRTQSPELRTNTAYTDMNMSRDDYDLGGGMEYSQDGQMFNDQQYQPQQYNDDTFQGDDSQVGDQFDSQTLSPGESQGHHSHHYHHSANVGESGMHDEGSLERPHSIGESVLSDGEYTTDGDGGSVRGRDRKKSKSGKSKSKKSKKDKKSKRKSRSYASGEDESGDDSGGGRQSRHASVSDSDFEQQINEQVQKTLMALNLVPATIMEERSFIEGEDNGSVMAPQHLTENAAAAAETVLAIPNELVGKDEKVLSIGEEHMSAVNSRPLSANPSDPNAEGDLTRFGFPTDPSLVGSFADISLGPEEPSVGSLEENKSFPLTALHTTNRIINDSIQYQQQQQEHNNRYEQQHHGNYHDVYNYQHDQSQSTMDSRSRMYIPHVSEIGTSYSPPPERAEFGTSYSPPPLSRRASCEFPILAVQAAMEAAGIDVSGALITINATSPLAHMYPLGRAASPEHPVAPLSLSSPYHNSTNKIVAGKSGLNSNAHLERKQAQLAKQAARETTTRLKGEIEQCLSDIETLNDDLSALRDTRNEVRYEVVKWVFHFHGLCGYEPENIDKIRSRVFQAFVESFVETQTAMRVACAEINRLSDVVRLTLTQLVDAQDHAIALGAIRVREDFATTYTLSAEEATFVEEDPYTVRPDAEQLLTLGDSKPLADHGETNKPIKTALTTHAESSDEEGHNAPVKTMKKKVLKKKVPKSGEHAEEADSAAESDGAKKKIKKKVVKKGTKKEAVVEPEVDTTSYNHRSQNDSHLDEDSEHSNWRDEVSFDASGSLLSQHGGGLDGEGSQTRSAIPVYPDYGSDRFKADAQQLFNKTFANVDLILTGVTHSEESAEMIALRTAANAAHIHTTVEHAGDVTAADDATEHAVDDTEKHDDQSEDKHRSNDEQHDHGTPAHDHMMGGESLDGNSMISDFRYQQPHFDGPLPEEPQDFDLFQTGLEESSLVQLVPEGEMGIEEQNIAHLEGDVISMEPIVTTEDGAVVDKVTSEPVTTVESEPQSGFEPEAIVETVVEPEAEPEPEPEPIVELEPEPEPELEPEPVYVPPSPSELEALRKEYSRLKKDLKKWQNAFIKANGREPTVEDADNMDVEVMVKIERKDELKEILDEYKAFMNQTAIAESSAGEDLFGSRPHTVEGPTLTANGDMMSYEDAFHSGLVCANTTTPFATPAAFRNKRDAPAIVTPFEPVAPKYSPEEIASMTAEYSRVKKDMKRWMAAFVRERGVEPTIADFATLDADTMAMIARKEELRAILDEVKASDALDSSDNEGGAYSRSPTKSPRGVHPNQIPEESSSIVLPPIGANESLAELNREYNKIKKELRSWMAAFVQEHGREPTADDFDSLDVALRRQIARKNQLKAHLAEMKSKAGK